MSTTTPPMTGRRSSPPRPAPSCARGTPRQGNVVCRMFADVDADVYVLADGDGTYDPTDAPAMLDRLLPDNLDMVVGCRVPAGGTCATFPRGHVVGQLAVQPGSQGTVRGQLHRCLLGLPGDVSTLRQVVPGTVHGVRDRDRARDPHRGHRAPARRDANDLSIPQRRVQAQAAHRAGRVRILVAALLLFKEMRPLRFFTIIAATLTLLALGLGAIPVSEFISTGLVLRLPTAVLAASIQIIAFISLTAGIILDSVCHGRRQAKRLVYLSMSPVSASLGSSGSVQRGSNGERSHLPRLLDHHRSW